MKKVFGISLLLLVASGLVFWWQKDGLEKDWKEMKERHSKDKCNC